MADVSELERQARELLRPEVYEYYAGGSGGEVTLRANDEAWRQVRFLPRVLRDVSAVRTSVRLGTPLNLELRTPVAVAPTAFHRLAHPQGEAATATGAARAGALFVLSTRSSRRIEDVAAAVAGAGGHWWFQVYMMRERELTAGLVRRATAAGAQALVLTGDTPVVGRQALVPGGGVISDRDLSDNPGRLDDVSRARFVPAGLADIGWLTEISGGLPVLVKGVLRGDDAAGCLAAGAAGVIVSNHGGRQLDQALPTALALPAVRAAAAAQPVFVDGGVRSPENVLAGLALWPHCLVSGRWPAPVCAGPADPLITLEPAFACRSARTYLGGVKTTTGGRRNRAHLVTEAQPPLSADIASRTRRYLIMMGIRVACFGATIALFAEGAGWFAAIPAVGAIAIPYFAVVIANGGREPASTTGFRAYEPRLPARYTPPDAAGWPAGRREPEGPPAGSQQSRPFSRETEAEKQSGNG